MSAEYENRPLFSVVIPARNEEAHLPGCLSALAQAAAYAKCSYETIVVLNRCTDRTEEVAKQAGCLLAYDDSKNLARIRNAGAKLATGRWLITVDADSRVSGNLMQEVAKRLSSSTVIGGGVFIVPDRLSLGIFLTGVCLLPIVLWYGISAGLFFCALEDFRAIGGFNEELSSVEDIDFAKRLKQYGKKRGKRYANLLRSYIVTSSRKFDLLGDWYFMRHPWEFISLLCGRNQKLADKVWYDIPR